MDEGSDIIARRTVHLSEIAPALNESKLLTKAFLDRRTKNVEYFFPWLFGSDFEMPDPVYTLCQDVEQTIFGFVRGLGYYYQNGKFFYIYPKKADVKSIDIGNNVSICFVFIHECGPSIYYQSEDYYEAKSLRSLENIHLSEPLDLKSVTKLLHDPLNGEHLVATDGNCKTIFQIIYNKKQKKFDVKKIVEFSDSIADFSISQSHMLVCFDTCIKIFERNTNKLLWQKNIITNRTKFCINSECIFHLIKDENKLHFLRIEDGKEYGNISNVGSLYDGGCVMFKFKNENILGYDICQEIPVPSNTTLAACYDNNVFIVVKKKLNQL